MCPRGSSVKTRPVLLAIFDGFGLNPSRAYNAWALARTPHLDHYFASYPHTVLQASGRAVGLPDGQFGNSEVGHLTLGSGRVLEQDLIRIADAIYDGSIEEQPAWQAMLDGAQRIHLVGMVSDGGVHSHIEHLLGILNLLRKTEIEPVVHMITDGRDTAPHAALAYLEMLEENLARLGRGRIASVSGRYCAMDRVKHWDRTERAWTAMVRAQGLRVDSPREAIESAYARGEGDEFIQPTVITGHSGIAPDDPVLFFNFRSDRARQLSAAFGLAEFDAFDRGGVCLQRLVCMTEYDANYPFPVLFAPQVPEQVLAEVPVDLIQFHGAEPAAFCRSFNRPYIKALGMADQLDLATKAAPYQDARGLLLDSHAMGDAGGTGQAFDWQAIPPDFRRRIILAGGLKPDNIAAAIRAVRPYAVDLSSGVESAPGIKDVVRMTRLMNEVKRVDCEAV